MQSGLITKNDIGKAVYLSNSATACQEWVIADVGHYSNTGYGGGTYKSVDLFPKHVLSNSIVFKKSNEWDFETSNIRAWLNDNLYNGFTAEVRNAMITCSYYAYKYDTNKGSLSSKVFNDKVVCVSMEDVGVTSDNYIAYKTGGSCYPIFGTASTNNTLAAYTDTNGSYRTYWTRTPYNDYGNFYCIGPNSWTVDPSGNVTINNVSLTQQLSKYSNAVLAYIKF